MRLVLDFIYEFWTILCQIAPPLLFGFFVAGILSIMVSAEYVKKHLGKNGSFSVVKASLFGVPLPLCSCGVLPVALSLKEQGAGKGAVVSFLISTPQTGIDSIFVTYGMLGWVFAVFRPVAAFVSGVLGGMLVDMSCKDGNDEKEDKKQCHCCCKAEKEESCCSHGKKENPIAKVLKYGFITLLGDISKPLLLGIFAATIISLLLPPEVFEKAGTGFTGMLLMLLFGIPLYVCATASVPIGAVLLLKGVSPGAVFVFLMAGPATNITAIISLFKIIGKKAVMIYLFSVVVSALFFGFVLDAIGTGGVSSGMLAHIHDTGGVTGLQNLCGIVLLMLMLYGIANNFRKKGVLHLLF